MEIIDKNKYFVVSADCIPVKGYKRSCIYDLTRKKYYFIPNSLAEILLSYNGLRIIKLYEDCDNSPILNEYFKFLIEKEIIYQANEWELEHFSKLNLEWKHPSKISTALIDIDITSTVDVSKLKDALDGLGVKHLQIRQVGEMKSDFVAQLLSGLSDTRLKSIELILPFTIDFINISKAYKKANPKVLLIYYYEAPDVKNIFDQNLPKLILTTDSKDSLFIEKSPHPKYFAVNIQSFTEAQHHHTFYNRKIFIDKDCHLKNSLFSTKEFGHVDEININDVISTPEFQEFWTVEKDKTEICKDCEFRYMCTDQRLPEKSDNDWIHKTNCRYNPYLAKWEWEEGFEVPANKLNEIHEGQIK